MKFNGYTFGVLICLLMLLVGSIIHIFAGYSHSDLSGHAWGSDDAYIGYRYAKNIAQGHGAVFNPGERVEGYSNFLYVLLMSLVFIVADDGVYLFSSLLNIFFITVAFLIFYRYVQSQLGDLSATLAVFLFALCPPIWVWVASGMETPLIMLLQLAIWMAVERVADDQELKHLVLLCLVMILSILARADGFVVPGIAILYLLFKGRRRPALYCTVTILLTITAYFLWRYDYYGYLLPNTYYQKVSGPLMARLKSALGQLGGLALHQGLLAYLLTFLFVLTRAMKNFIQGRSRILQEIRFETAFAVSWLLYWTYIGGDVFQERFLIILFPLGIFMLLKTIGPTLPKKTLLLFVVLLVIHQLSCLATDPRFEYSLTKYDRWIILGKFLGKNHPGKMLAIDAAGKVPYFSGLRTLDMLGANDEFIAHKDVDYFNAGHNKFDPEYLLSKSPDLIAAWITNKMDLAYGLERKKYERAGYRVRYLVNSSKNSSATNIMDVDNLDEQVIRRLIGLGYKYAVLEKK